MNKQAFKVPSKKPIIVMALFSLIFAALLLNLVILYGIDEFRWSIAIVFFLTIAGIANAIDRYALIQRYRLMNGLYELLLKYPEMVYLQGNKFRLEREQFLNHNINYVKYLWLREQDIYEVVYELKRGEEDE